MATDNQILNALKGIGARLGGVETSVKGIAARLDNLEKSVATKKQIDDRFDTVEGNMAKMEASLVKQIKDTRKDLADRIAKVATTSPTNNMFTDLEERVDKLEEYHKN